jgi:hypothetical protein
MIVIFFKLRQKRQETYLTGYASSIEIGDGRILLKDRRVPLACFVAGQEGVPTETAQLLGDLEKPADSENGWAAWGFPVEAPAWWDRVTPAPAEAAVPA